MEIISYSSPTIHQYHSLPLTPIKLSPNSSFHSASSLLLLQHRHQSIYQHHLTKDSCSSSRGSNPSSPQQSTSPHHYLRQSNAFLIVYPYPDYVVKPITRSNPLPLQLSVPLVMFKEPKVINIPIKLESPTLIPYSKTRVAKLEYKEFFKKELHIQFKQCNNFQKQIWRPKICSNCFNSIEEHHQSDSESQIVLLVSKQQGKENIKEIEERDSIKEEEELESRLPLLNEVLKGNVMGRVAQFNMKPSKASLNPVYDNTKTAPSPTKYTQIVPKLIGVTQPSCFESGPSLQKDIKLSKPVIKIQHTTKNYKATTKSSSSLVSITISTSTSSSNLLNEDTTTTTGCCLQVIPEIIPNSKLVSKPTSPSLSSMETSTTTTTTTTTWQDPSISTTTTTTTTTTTRSRSSSIESYSNTTNGINSNIGKQQQPSFLKSTSSTSDQLNNVKNLLDKFILLNPSSY